LTLQVKQVVSISNKKEEPIFTVKFYGVRGSIPVPGPQTIKYGGNTPCVFIESENSLIIIDAGTGIRLLGQDLLKKPLPITAHLLLSHTHSDHIHGFPFFSPAFIKGNKFYIYCFRSTDKSLEKVLTTQMELNYFPVNLNQLHSTLIFVEIEEGNFFIDNNIKVETIYLNHPGLSFGYRLTKNNASIVYASDNEPFFDSFIFHSEDLQDLKEVSEKYKKNISIVSEHVKSIDSKIIKFAKDANILIFDAQYTEEEFKSKIGWGHSTYNRAVEVALAANVEHLILFHHEPQHDDDTIDTILQNAIEFAKRLNPDSSLKITAAYEGLTLKVP